LVPDRATETGQSCLARAAMRSKVCASMPGTSARTVSRMSLIRNSWPRWFWRTVASVSIRCGGVPLAVSSADNCML
jgi:hypothetical protein